MSVSSLAMSLLFEADRTAPSASLFRASPSVARSARRANHAKPVSSPAAKNVRLALSAKSLALLRASCPARGALRDRHERWVQDAMGAATSDDEWCCLHTAKSCGPDASTPASSSRRRVPRLSDDSDKKARSLGRARRKPLKPLRRECRSFGVPVVTNSCALFMHARLRVH